VSPDTGLFEVFEQLTRASVNQLPVLENGQWVGMVARENLLAFLRARSETGG
jgi:signal-transduction protein with cAMP-binding, CBS, and nucleotidyltransferase domain